MFIPAKNTLCLDVLNLSINVEHIYIKHFSYFSSHVAVLHGKVWMLFRDPGWRGGRVVVCVPSGHADPTCSCITNVTQREDKTAAERNRNTKEEEAGAARCSRAAGLPSRLQADTCWLPPSHPSLSLSLFLLLPPSPRSHFPPLSLSLSLTLLFSVSERRLYQVGLCLECHRHHSPGLTSPSPPNPLRTNRRQASPEEKSMEISHAPAPSCIFRGGSQFTISPLVWQWKDRRRRFHCCRDHWHQSKTEL